MIPETDHTIPGIGHNNPPVIWEPQPGSQYLFIHCPIFEVLYEGTRGPGKTDALIMDFLQHVGEGFGAAWRGILFRQTYPQLQDVIAKTKKWFWQIFPDAKYNASEHKWTFPDGEELFLRHMAKPDDYWNYHGHEYPWIGWEELTNWPTRDCYESMKACCRSTHPGIPVVDDDGNVMMAPDGSPLLKRMPRKYRATCNPYGSGHNWVKAYFIEPAPAGVLMFDKTGRARVRLHGSIFENKFLLDNDPDYLNNLLSIRDSNKRKAWLEGSWDIVAGGMFDDVWDQRIHVLAPFKIPRHWYIDRAFDWGSSKPFAVGWFAESDGSDVVLSDGTIRSTVRGDLFLFAEYYGWNGEPNEGLKMLASDIAREIKEREDVMRLSNPGMNIRPGPADSSIFDTENGNCISDDMAGEGIEWTRADKSPGSRKLGWEKLRSRLSSAMKPQREDPGFFVFNTCRNWIRTVPVLSRLERDPDDVDTNAEDHHGDMTRYRVYHRKDVVGQVRTQGH